VNGEEGLFGLSSKVSKKGPANTEGENIGYFIRGNGGGRGAYWGSQRGMGPVASRGRGGGLQLKG